MLYDVHTRKINAPITISSSGDNVIVAGTPDNWIYVHEIIGDAAAAVTLQIKSGATVLAEFALDAGQGLTLSDIPGDDQRPRFEFKPGDDFIINLSGAVAFNGNVAYSFRN
jgi:hypothetical protein